VSHDPIAHPAQAVQALKRFPQQADFVLPSFFYREHLIPYLGLLSADVAFNFYISELPSKKQVRLVEFIEYSHAVPQAIPSKLERSAPIGKMGEHLHVAHLRTGGFI
jgi:hypothetical protein